MTGQVGNAYAGSRARVTALCAQLADDAAARPVVACPGWTVHDVVAHLAGGMADAVAGRLEGAGTPTRTTRQVAERRGLSINEILEQWQRDAAAIEPLMDGAGDLGRQAVADIVSHEHDLRSALVRPGARNSDAIHVGLSFLGPRFVESATSHGVTVQVRIPDQTTFGAGDPDVYLSAEPFELLRALTGRRSVSQLRELDWKGDVDRVLPAFSFLTLQPAAAPIHE